MSTTLDIEELHSTKSEKLLAYVLVAFLLIGGVWSYQEIDDRVRSSIELGAPTAAETEALRRRDEAQQRLFQANQQLAQTRREVEFRREEFRAALDADRPAAALEQRYRNAQDAFAKAQVEQREAQRAFAAAQPAASDAQRSVGARMDERRDRQELFTFLFRLLLVLVSLLVGYAALAWLRNRSSRYLPLGGAVLGFATILAFALAGDYLTDYFNPFELGLLLLSLVGVLATLAAFWVLQRYLARRLPQRRVRKGQCPFAGSRSAPTNAARAAGDRWWRLARAARAHAGWARAIARPAAGPRTSAPYGTTRRATRSAPRTRVPPCPQPATRARRCPCHSAPRRRRHRRG